MVAIVSEPRAVATGSQTDFESSKHIRIDLIGTLGPVATARGSDTLLGRRT